MFDYKMQSNKNIFTDNWHIGIKNRFKIPKIIFLSKNVSKHKSMKFLGSKITYLIINYFFTY